MVPAELDTLTTLPCGFNNGNNSLQQFIVAKTLTRHVTSACSENGSVALVLYAIAALLTSTSKPPCVDFKKSLNLTMLSMLSMSSW